MRVSRNDAVDSGNTGRWPVVFGGPPNTLFNQIELHQTVRSKTVGQSFRPAAENDTRARAVPISLHRSALNAELMDRNTEVLQNRPAKNIEHGV